MAIRISIFAVNVSDFRPWLGRTLSDVFLYIAREHLEETSFPSVYDPENRTRYCVTAERKIIALPIGLPKREITEVSPRTVPILSQSVGDWLRAGSMYDLLFLCRGLSLCPQVKGIRELTSGFKAFWVGSLLWAATHLSAFPRHSLFELEQLLSRIVRGYQCWYPLPSGAPPEPTSFPCLPAEDGDCRMGVFSHAEARRLLELFDALLELRPTFLDPSNRHHDETDWDDWVRQMIAEFSVIRDLPGEPTMLSWID